MSSNNRHYRSYSNFTDSKGGNRHQNPKKSHKLTKFMALIVMVVLIVIGTYSVTHGSSKPQGKATAIMKTTNKLKTTPTPTTKTLASDSPTSSACAGNTLAQVLIVSISARHLWACADSSQLYDTAVITGDINVPADVTPIGTYYIYSKQTDTHLIGSDSRGSWNDYVNYWMPFYDSPAYGIFGLHDATWRTAQDFGNISPDSDDASHGCVELPLAAAAWIYNWSVVGTTVKIEA
jgi:lipoprotein-anchoring transpeptidase ErfK/SrfK